jgi:hypothetical protein
VAGSRQNCRRGNTVRVAPETPAGSARSSLVFVTTSRVHPDVILLTLSDAKTLLNYRYETGVSELLYYFHVNFTDKSKENCLCSL